MLPAETYFLNSYPFLPSGSIALLGIPWDENSSYLRGAAAAPGQIRHVLADGASTWYSRSGVNLQSHPQLYDLGDLKLESGQRAVEQISAAIDACLQRGVKTLALGGDHAITYPILLAYARHFPALNILQIDAHTDLYDVYEDNRLSHACPFARIMENGLAARLVQVGIRTLSPHLQQQIERFQVQVIRMQDWSADLQIHFDGPLYLSLDLDALDPAFAPGVSHHEPGGMTTREVLQLIDSIKAPLVGADIVELNPQRDQNQVTARLAAVLLKEIAAKMLETSSFHFS